MGKMIAASVQINTKKKTFGYDRNFLYVLKKKFVPIRICMRAIRWSYDGGLTDKIYHFF